MFKYTVLPVTPIRSNLFCQSCSLLLAIFSAYGVIRAMQKEDLEIQKAAGEVFPSEYLLGEPIHLNAHSILRQVKTFTQLATEKSRSYCALYYGLALANFANTRSRGFLESLNSSTQMKKDFTAWQMLIKNKRYQQSIAIELTNLVMNNYKRSSELSVPLLDSELAKRIIRKVFFEKMRSVTIDDFCQYSLTKEFVSELILENSMHFSEGVVGEFLRALDLLFYPFEIKIKIMCGSLVCDGLPIAWSSVTSDSIDCREVISLFESQRLRETNWDIDCLFYASDLLESERRKLADLRYKIKQDKNLTAIIMVCTGKTEMLQLSLRYVLVVHISNGRHEYFVTDLFSDNPISESCVLLLVRYLEGESELLDISDNQMPRLTSGLVSGNQRETIVSASLEPAARRDVSTEGGIVAVDRKIDGRLWDISGTVCRNAQVVKQLLPYDAERKLEEVSLYRAAQKGYVENIELLVQKNKKMVGERKRDLFIMAAENGHENVVIYLLDSFPRNEAIIYEALFVAAAHGHTHVVKLLLKIFEASSEFNELKSKLFWSAVQDGHKDIIELLLNARVDKNWSRSDGATPLSLAAQNGHLAVVKMLLVAGAAVDGSLDWDVTNYTASPLFKAAQAGYTNIVAALIKKGAKRCFPSASIIKSTASYNQEIKKMLQGDQGSDSSRNCFLVTAVIIRDVEFCKALLAAGENVNRPDMFGHTPLHYAAMRGFEEIATLLLANGADVSVTNRKGRTPLYLAAINGQVDVVKLLLGQSVAKIAINGHVEVCKCLDSPDENCAKFVETLLAAGARADAVKSDGVTLLHSAAQRGNTEAVNLLLVRGVDLLARKNNRGLTPLHLAAAEGHERIVEKLVKAYDAQGLNANESDQDGWMPLHCAAASGHVRVVKLLVQTTDLQARNTYGRTPLHFATFKGDAETVEELAKVYIARGLDINESDQEGVTPLHLAAAGGRVRAVKILLRNGARANLATNKGLTPWQVAYHYYKYELEPISWYEVIKELFAQGEDANMADNDESKPLHCVARDGHVELVEILLNAESEAGVRKKISGENGAELLGTLVEAGHHEIIRLLLARGVDANVLCDANMTLLHTAAMLGLVDVANVLLDAGANEKAANTFGMTPLHMAAIKDCHEIVTLLLNRGADVVVADNDGLTPLHYASQRGSVQVVETLLFAGASVKAIDNDGKTPLDFAIQKGRSAVIDLLKKAN